MRGSLVWLDIVLLEVAESDFLEDSEHELSDKDGFSLKGGDLEVVYQFLGLKELNELLEVVGILVLSVFVSKIFNNIPDDSPTVVVGKENEL